MEASAQSIIQNYAFTECLPQLIDSVSTIFSFIFWRKSIHGEMATHTKYKSSVIRQID